MAARGIFNLNTPETLVRKLAQDYTLFEQQPFNPYLAFNFFVTAEHIPDWIGDKDIKKKHSILRICSHLANGAKHFEVDPKRHQSVRKTEKALYCERGYLVNGFIEEPLIVHLSNGEIGEFGQPHIEAVKIAKSVLEFWLDRFPDVRPES